MLKIRPEKKIVFKLAPIQYDCQSGGAKVGNYSLWEAELEGFQHLTQYDKYEWGACVLFQEKSVSSLHLRLK